MYKVSPQHLDNVWTIPCAHRVLMSIKIWNIMHVMCKSSLPIVMLSVMYSGPWTQMTGRISLRLSVFVCGYVTHVSEFMSINSNVGSSKWHAEIHKSWLKRWSLLRSAVGKTHVLRSRLVMNYTTSYFPFIVLGYPLDSKRSSLP